MGIAPIFGAQRYTFLGYAARGLQGYVLFVRLRRCRMFGIPLFLSYICSGIGAAAFLPLKGLPEMATLLQTDKITVVIKKTETTMF